MSYQHLERCEICQGKGKIKGVFHLMECAGCNGGGLVCPDGKPLDYPQLVEQLRLRLAMSGNVRRLQQVELERLGLGRSGEWRTSMAGVISAAPMGRAGQGTEGAP